MSEVSVNLKYVLTNGEKIEVYGNFFTATKGANELGIIFHNKTRRLSYLLPIAYFNELRASMRNAVYGAVIRALFYPEHSYDNLNASQGVNTRGVRTTPVKINILKQLK